MKTSARNQFEGTVTSIQEGAVNDVVELGVGPGLRIVATITSAARAHLALKVGSPAFALVKASSIILLTEADDVRLSARNQLNGTVASVKTGAVNSEVLIDLKDAKVQLAAVVTNDSAAHLALQQGSPVTAIFKVSSVVLGVRA
jgi:molybdate transport system regulatory protein